MRVNASIVETKHKNWMLNIILWDTMHKSLLVAFLTATIVIGLASTFNMFFGIVYAKPSVPEFTIKLVAYPYDIPPTTTTTTDQYTGEKTTITKPGYTVENKSIEITIKNQPFTPYTDESGYEHNLYYNVRAKGHFGEDWETFYSEYQASSSSHPLQSSSEYTVLSFLAKYPDGAQIDFQVEAIVGHYYDPLVGRPVIASYFLAVDEKSDWSNQTITIDEYQTQIFSTSPSPMPTSSPTTQTTYRELQQTDQTEIIIGAIITVAVLGAGLGFLFYLIKRK